MSLESHIDTDIVAITIADDDDNDSPAAALRRAADWLDTQPDRYYKHVDVWYQDEMGFWGVTFYAGTPYPREAADAPR